MDLLSLAALVQTASEWLALGWLSGVDFPAPQAPFWAPRWSLRLLVGAFLVGASQLILALVGPGFGDSWLVLTVAAIGAAVIRLTTRPARHQAQATMPLNRAEAVGWLLLAAVAVAATIRALLVPEAGWDAFSHWGLKAEAYALSGTIVDTGTVHEYYPPLVPLLEAWLYLHRGGVSIDLGKTIWPLFGGAFVTCLAWHLRTFIRQPDFTPYLGIGILLGTPQLLESFWTGQADLALTAYLTLASLAVLQWQRAPHAQWLIQAAVFGAAAALTKYEGLPRLAVVVIAIAIEAVLSKRATLGRPAIALSVASATGYAPWLVFRATHAIGSSAEHISHFQPEALGAVLLALVAALGGVRTGGGILAAALVWLIAARALLTPPLRLLGLVVLGQFIATVLAFLLGDTSPQLQVQTSATRLFEQFMPLALFGSAVWLADAVGIGARAEHRGPAAQPGLASVERDVARAAEAPR